MDDLVNVSVFDKVQEVSHVGLLLLSCSVVLRRLRWGLTLWIPSRSHWGRLRRLPERLCLDRRDSTVEGRWSADNSLVRLLRNLRPESRDRLLDGSHLLGLVLSDHWLMLHRNLFRACCSRQRILRDRHLGLRVMRGL